MVFVESTIEKHRGDIIPFEFDRDYVDFILIEMDRFDQPMTRTLLSFLRKRYGDEFWYCIDISGDQRLDAYVIGGPEKDKEERNVIHIYSIAVRREFEGQGWAKKLMLHLLADAQRQQKDRVVLEVRENNSRALEFYKKLGFVRSGRLVNYYNNDIDAIIMHYTF